MPKEFWESMTKKDLWEKWHYFEEVSKTYRNSADYYQAELCKAHELLGRVVHQASERWDRVNLTKWYPTDNLNNRRTVNNPKGE